MSDLQNKEVQGKEEEKKLPLTWERLVKMGFHVWRQFDDQYYAGFAGMLAYFFLMSAVPMLIVLTQVLGIFDISMDFVREWLTTHLSTHMSSFMESLFSASSTGISNFIMIILVLWASSSLSFSLSRLTTYTLTNGKYRYSYFTERLKAIPMALILILAVATILVVYVYGELIAQSVLRNPKIYAVISELRTPLLAVMFFLFMLLIYYVLPRVRVPIKAVLPGAVLATFSLVLPSILVILIVSRFLQRFQDSVLVKRILSGLRPASVGLIAAAGFGILKLALQIDPGADMWISWKALGTGLVLAGLYAVFGKKAHPILFIGLGAAAGLVMGL